MKRLICTVLGLAVAGLLGCEQGSSTAPSSKPGEPSAKRVLKVTSPGEQTVTQDQTDEMTISINRDNFAGPVDIKLENLPAGVNTVTKEMTIPAGNDSLTVTIKADPTAGVVEDHKVTVVATAKEETALQPARVDFNLDVKPKK